MQSSSQSANDASSLDQSNATTLEVNSKVKWPGIVAILSFIFAVLFFSGLLASEKWYGIFDFTVLNGSFGQLVSSVTQTASGLDVNTGTLRGTGGSGAMDGFLFAFSLVPSIMFAVAMVSVFEYYGAIHAAEWMLNPILRPMMGIPGSTALSVVASLQSTDAGAALTRTLKDQGALTEREVLIFATFQMTAGAALGNFLSTGVAIFAIHDHTGAAVVPTTIATCLGVILICKVFGANVMRLITLFRKA